MTLPNIVMHGSRLCLTSRTPGDLNVTQNTYSFLFSHTKELLLVVYCDLTAENGFSFRTHKQNRTDGWTDRRDIRNSYLDIKKLLL